MNIWDALAAMTGAFLESPLAAVVASGASALGGYWFRSALATSAAKRYAVSQLIEAQRVLANVACDQDYALVSDDLSLKRSSFDKKEDFEKYVYPLFRLQFMRRLDEIRELSLSNQLSPQIAPLIRTYRDLCVVFLDDAVLREKNSPKFWDTYATTKKQLHRVIRALGHFKPIEAAIIEGGVATDAVDSSRPRNVLGYADKAKRPR